MLVAYLAEVPDVQDVPLAPSLVDPLPLVRHVLVLVLDRRPLAVGQPGAREQQTQLRNSVFISEQRGFTNEGQNEYWLCIALKHMIIILSR